MQDFKDMREQRKLRKMTVQTNSQKYLNPINSQRSNQNTSRSPRKENLNESVDVLYKSNQDTHERDLEGRADVFSRLQRSAKQRK